MSDEELYRRYDLIFNRLEYPQIPIRHPRAWLAVTFCTAHQNLLEVLQEHFGWNLEMRPQPFRQRF